MWLVERLVVVLLLQVEVLDVDNGMVLVVDVVVVVDSLDALAVPPPALLFLVVCSCLFPATSVGWLLGWFGIFRTVFLHSECRRNYVF